MVNYGLFSSYQLNAHFLYSITIYICHNIILNMFWAVPCSSSGGQIVLLQPLVSLLSVNGHTVCRLKADSALNQHTVRPFTESDHTRCCNNTICPPEDEQGTARNMLRIVMWNIYCYRIKEVCIKLVTWKKVYTMMHGQKNIKLWLTMIYRKCFEVVG